MAESRIDHATEQPIGVLLGQLSEDMTLLMRQEVALAKAEMSQKAAEAARDAVALTAGGAVAYAGILVLLAAAVLGLTALGLAAWLSALIVGVVVALIGLGLVQGGLRDLKTMQPVPERTVETVRNDVAWAKDQLP